MKAHTEPTTVHIAAAKAHTYSVTNHIAAVTVHTHPFKPTATTHEKMANPFSLERFQTLGSKQIIKKNLSGVRLPAVFRNSGKGVSETGKTIWKPGNPFSVFFSFLLQLEKPVLNRNVGS